jgi:D-galacturonate reductase
MKILVVGAGMYVTGRGGTGPGTLLSSIAETSLVVPIEEVTVVATNPANAAVVQEAVARINSAIGANLKVRYRTVEAAAGKAIQALCGETHYDGAIVSVPDQLHFSYAKALLNQGVHCLIVKPLTPTLAEARELEELRGKMGLYGAVEFHKRWDATNLWIRRALQERKLGKLLYFTVEYSQKITIPMTTFRAWSSRTNIFQYLGVHYVDLIWFLTGFVPVRAMAVGTEGVLRANGVDTWDSVHATVIWRNRADAAEWFVSQLSTNWVDPACTSAMSDQKYNVVGTRGRLECNQKNRGLELVHEDLGIQQINPYFSDYLPGIDGRLAFRGYGHESISQFVQDVFAIGNGKVGISELQQGRPSIREALVSTAVIDAVNESLAANFAWTDVRDPF